MRRGLLIVGIALLALAAWMMMTDPLGRKSSGPSDPSEISGNQSRESTRSPIARATNKSTASARQSIDEALTSLLDDTGDSASILNELKSLLLKDSPESAAIAVAEFLKTGQDAPTDQPFLVGQSGSLEGVPSLRTALMDWLPGMDPEVALEVARETLQHTDSPDEYAIALRNLAWNDLNGDLFPELSAAFHSMLDRQDWRQNPSNGYLEAFDLAVLLGDSETFLRLSEFASLEEKQPQLVHASCMALDRMVLRNPTHLTQAWLDQPTWMDDAPMQRASLMSRLEITMQDHQSLLLEYLASPRTKPEEILYFSEIFPNGNHLHGNRLATGDEPSSSIDERARLDREVIHLLDEILGTAPDSTKPHLSKIRTRLAGYVDAEKP